MDTRCEVSREIAIEIDGKTYRGRYRLMSGSVIVYYESEIKSAERGMTGPEVVAKWLLTDLVRKLETRKRKNGKAG